MKNFKPITHQSARRDFVLANKKALIADDDKYNIQILTSILKKFGMDVIAVDNGMDILNKLKEHGDINIVLTDMMMPIMDGYEALVNIRKKTCYDNLPVIMVTSKTMRNDREQYLLAGANDYIPKPVDETTLIASISRLLT